MTNVTDGAEPGQRKPGQDRLLVATVAGAFLACYAGEFVWLVRQWSSNDMYSHGFLVPFITGYLLWERRGALAALRIQPDVLGGTAVLLAGLAALCAGRIAGVLVLAELSLVVTALGLVLLLRGRSYARHCLVPLLFLLFMIPVWDIATARLHAPFQLLSARVGATLLTLCGIPVHLDGVLLSLPNITLEVARACSGVNFVVAILALALPQAYLLFRGVIGPAVVAAFAVVVALLTNGLRVAAIGVLSYNGWSDVDVHGPMHILKGLFVAVVGMIIVTSSIPLFAKWFPRRSASPSLPAPSVARDVNARLRWSLVVLASVLLLSPAALGALSSSRAVDPVLPLSDFPATLGGTWVRTVLNGRSVLGGDRADSALVRTYTNAAGRVMHVYVGYFRTQEQGREVIGQQMLAMENAATRLQMHEPGGGVTPVNAVVQSDGPYRARYILFWYDVNGRSTARGYVGKAWTAWDLVTRGRTNGAVVIVASDVPARTQDAAAVAAESQAFAALVAAELDAFLPR